MTPGIDADPVPKLIVCAVVVCAVHRRVKVGAHRGRKPCNDLLASNEPVPLVVSR